MNKPFHMVDVFSQEAFAGNPLAVVFEADDLSTQEMQHITRWMNLSETVFLQTPMHPDADYKARIFTLAHELPFAGHPTLGSCHAWLAAGGVAKNPGLIIQECGAGLIKIRHSNEKLAFAAPPLLRSGAVTKDDLQKICRILDINHSEIVAANWIDNGPGWVGILLNSADRVLEIQPKSNSDDRFDIGIIGPYPENSECDFEVRAIFNDQHGILREDPVTGSLNASLAQWMIHAGHAPSSYVASQGTKLERKGRVFIEKDSDGNIWVGGYSNSRVSGDIDLS